MMKMMVVVIIDKVDGVMKMIMMVMIDKVDGVEVEEAYRVDGDTRPQDVRVRLALISLSSHVLIIKIRIVNLITIVIIISVIT